MDLRLKDKKSLIEKIAGIRGHKEDEIYDIVLIGSGGVAKYSALFTSKLDDMNLLFPVRINILGRNKTFEKRQKLANAINNYTGKENVIPRNMEELPDLLEKTKMISFMASNHPSDETNRIVCSERNFEIIDEYEKFYNDSDYVDGVINVVSNLPEILAQYIIQKWGIDNVEKVTAHVPLDLKRYEGIIKDLLLINGKLGKYKSAGFKLGLVGYHDEVWPLIGGARMKLGYKIDADGILHEDLMDVEALITSKASQEDLVLRLKNHVPKTVSLYKKVKKQFGDDNEGPTVMETGGAFTDLIRAFVNGEETVTGIPMKFGEKWLFGNYPVNWIGKYPVPSKDFSDRNFTEKDKQEFYSRMIQTKDKPEGFSLESKIKNIKSRKLNDLVPTRKLQNDESRNLNKLTITERKDGVSKKINIYLGLKSQEKNGFKEPELLMISKHPYESNSIEIRNLYNPKKVEKVELPIDEKTFISKIKAREDELRVLTERIRRDSSLKEISVYSLDLNNKSSGFKHIYSFENYHINCFDFLGDNIFVSADNQANVGIIAVNILNDDEDIFKESGESNYYTSICVIPINESYEIIASKFESILRWSKEYKKIPTKIWENELESDLDVKKINGDHIFSFYANGKNAIQSIYDENKNPYLLRSKRGVLGLNTEEESIETTRVTFFNNLVYKKFMSLDLLKKNKFSEKNKIKISKKNKDHLGNRINNIYLGLDYIIVMGENGSIAYEKNGNGENKELLFQKTTKPYTFIERI